MATINCLVTNILQNIIFCVQQREIPFNVSIKTNFICFNSWSASRLFHICVPAPCVNDFMLMALSLVKYDLQSV